MFKLFQSAVLWNPLLKATEIFAAMLASEEDAEKLEAVENLLESYFVQIDSTFDKLEAVGKGPCLPRLKPQQYPRREPYCKFRIHYRKH